ncbi:T9SS type A sorting domain-containing protein [Duncaniella sp.]|uniref:T9SS type A sorting domain-containing protein n=1 Tax=Duncaniella sp. TaxID=2518496 RepID=UPI0023C1447D|nr:T9SS type A sorting domain-containing protein [Duncaniella sp.]MDE5905807.1 T9SS type A sorting domain-containing protein [Duncaniella sp.]
MIRKGRMLFSIIVNFIVGIVLADNIIVFNYDSSGNRMSRSFRLSEENGINVQIEKRIEPAEELALIDLEVKATPNPTPGLLHVEVDCDDSELQEISIFDIKGLLISQKEKAISDFDLSGRSSGIYILVVKTSFGSTSYKIIKI